MGFGCDFLFRAKFLHSWVRAGLIFSSLSRRRAREKSKGGFRDGIIMSSAAQLLAGPDKSSHRCAGTPTAHKEQLDLLDPN